MASTEEPATRSEVGASSTGCVEPPKLTQAERRTYGRLGMLMDQFHNHFRQTWNIMYSAVSSTSTTLSARRLIDTGLSFIEQLTAHHTIEERYLFPHLARRMPSFKPDAFAYTQHKAIHEGLDKMELYLRECQRGERDFRREQLMEVMDGFGEVLWQHLDEEVKELAAENMQRFWTLEEIQRMPI
ncbi:hypothetical protein K488DRAFT_55313 [Vararia minispora EC-137]|uniref:Uncharacterized protein n=1 Tax=Vararia minispora EC-137 TaxID=1314806 RepID=A0ACB8QE93_9AGAM|nr:hypothetical protein K488DRAFT_55313 [Vararia minispora EC-137]